jgi:hypothetical protein
MSGWRKKGASIDSGWYGPECIKVDETDYNNDWCRFLREEGYELGCEEWFPHNMQTADKFIRDFLIWKYGYNIREWAQQNGLGNRWKYEFNIWNDFNRRSRRKCGNIRGVALGRTYGGTRKSKSGTRKGRKASTRRH